MNQLLGEVTEVRPSFTRIAVDDNTVARHLRDHTLTNGTVNQVPANLRRVGQRVILEYRSAGSYGLWFVVGPA